MEPLTSSEIHILSTDGSYMRANVFDIIIPESVCWGTELDILLSAHLSCIVLICRIGINLVIFSAALYHLR